MSGEAAVDIRPTYAALAFTAEAAPVRCTVGGQGPFALRWKSTLRVPVAPGDVVVVVWSAWVTKSFMGTSHALLRLEPGQVVGLEWKMPQSIWGKGRMEVADTGVPVGLAVPTEAGVPPDAGSQQVAAPHPVRPLAEVPLAEGAASAASAAPPAWHPDPTGRHPYRWWDGARWTDAVSDGTATHSDPVPGL